MPILLHQQSPANVANLIRRLAVHLQRLHLGHLFNVLDSVAAERKGSADVRLREMEVHSTLTQPPGIRLATTFRLPNVQRVTCGGRLDNPSQVCNLAVGRHQVQSLVGQTKSVRNADLSTRVPKYQVSMPIPMEYLYVFPLYRNRFRLVDRNLRYVEKDHGLILSEPLLDQVSRPDRSSFSQGLC